MSTDTAKGSRGIQRDKLINKIVDLVFQLSDELQSIEDITPNHLFPLHPDWPVTNQFKDAKPLVDEMVALIKKQNGDMLSDHVILTKLLYNAAAIRLEIKISDKELEDIARLGVSNLIDYHAIRDVDVPILSLEIGVSPFTFGPVTFHPITDKDKQTDWWKRIKTALGDSIDTMFLSYARAKVPGDLHKSVNNAATIVNEALLLLRGIGFPITEKEQHQFGILNEYPLWRTVHYRPCDSTESTHIDAQSSLVTTIGPLHFPFDLQKDILLKITPQRLESLLSLVTRTDFSPEEEMPSRLLSGFRWLGEASKPDALVARFAKLAFSLEAFVGGDPKDDLLTTKGITASLAERTAFLVSDQFDMRMIVDKDIRKYYKMRSAIAHGRGSTVQPSDFEEFGQLVRQVGGSLIDKLGEFSSIDDLQKWVTIQRYSTESPHDPK